MKRAFYLASFLVAAVLGLAFFVFNSPAKAPDSSFVLLDGSRVKTSDFHGKVLLVNFWATSCTTCVAEMPALVATHRKFQPRGFETIAVAMQYDPPSYVLNFAQSRKLPFMVAIDNTGGLASAWDDVRLTPTTYVVDKQGSIVKRFVGTPDFSDLDRLLETLLVAD